MSGTTTIDGLKLARELLGSAYQRHMAANPYCMSGIGSREAESVARDYIGAHTAVACCVDELQRLTAERDALAARERVCPTMQEAEARALVRALQEIAASVGLGLEASPADVVSAVKSLAWSWR